MKLKQTTSQNHKLSTLGFNIKKLRNQKKITQETLAVKANVKYSNLIKIESGKIKNPSVYTIARLAKSLEVPIEKLIYSK